MPHLPGFFVDNFRVFSSPALFDFSAVNILTGPNNSGKSSLIKAILLLKENFTGNHFPNQLQFKDDSHRLGSFEFVLNNPETSFIDLGFSISWVAPLISENIENEQWLVTLKYEKAKDNPQKNPLLICLKIWEKNSGEVLLEVNYQKNEVLLHDGMDGSLSAASSKINSELICKISDWFSFDRKTGLSQLAKSLLVKDYLINSYALGIPESELLKEESYKSSSFKNNVKSSVYFESKKIELKEKPLLKYVKEDKEIPFSKDEIQRLIEIEEQALNNLASGKSGFHGDEEFIRLLSRELDPFGFFYFSNNCHTTDSDNFKIYQSNNFTILGNNAPLVFEFFFYEVLYLLWKSNLRLSVVLDPDLYNQRAYLDSREAVVPDQIAKMEKFLDAMVVYFQTLIGSVLKNVSYVPSYRVSQSRIYTKTSETNILANLLGKVEDLSIVPSSIEFHFLNYWIKYLEIGEEIFVEPLEGSNSRIIVKRNGKIFNLADLGYGSAQIISVLLQIIIHARLRYDWYDYLCFFKKSLMLIEEPEANLHPKLQSRLAEMFIDAANRFNIQFIIETHSEYLIRKFQYIIAKERVKPDIVKVFYFYNPENIPTNEPQIKSMTIDSSGTLSSDFGPGFLDEADNIAIDLFKVVQSNQN